MRNIGSAKLFKIKININAPKALEKMMSRKISGKGIIHLN